MQRLEDHAHETMNDGQDAIADLNAKVTKLIATVEQLAIGFAEEVEDGVKLQAQLEILGRPVPVSGTANITFREGDEEGVTTTEG